MANAQQVQDFMLHADNLDDLFAESYPSCNEDRDDGILKFIEFTGADDDSVADISMDDRLAKFYKKFDHQVHLGATFDR